MRAIIKTTILENGTADLGGIDTVTKDESGNAGRHVLADWYDLEGIHHCIVAVDAGIEELLKIGGVLTEAATAIVGEGKALVIEQAVKSIKVPAGISFQGWADASRGTL